MLKQNCLRDGLAWERLKRVQILLTRIKDSLRAISGYSEKVAEQAAKKRRKAAEQDADTYRFKSERRSVYKGAWLLRCVYTGEVLKVLGRNPDRWDNKDEGDGKIVEDMFDNVVHAFS